MSPERQSSLRAEVAISAGACERKQCSVTEVDEYLTMHYAAQRIPGPWLQHPTSLHNQR